MNDYIFGDGYRLNYDHQPSMTPGDDGTDWDDVTWVEIEGVLFVQEQDREIAPGEWLQVSQTQKVRHWCCPSCGQDLCVEQHRTVPFEWASVVELPNFCPNCGVGLVRSC